MLKDRVSRGSNSKAMSLVEITIKNVILPITEKPASGKNQSVNMSQRTVEKKLLKRKLVNKRNANFFSIC